MTHFDNIPDELKRLPQWACWKGGKAPRQPDGRAAASTDPATWSTFDECRAAVEDGRADGLGFVFTGDDPYCGIDLDDVIDPATGNMDPDVTATTLRFNSYYERSPSGSGVHVILKGSLAGLTGNKRGDRECYDRSRFFTVTGDVVDPRPVRECQAELAAWHAETFPPTACPSAAWHQDPTAVFMLGMADHEVLERIRRSKQADKADRLWHGDTSDYASGSEADLALCSILGFWCQRDASAVDRLFRASGLMRPKWDAKRGQTTYGALTVAKACAAGDSYDPNYRSPVKGLQAVWDAGLSDLEKRAKSDGGPSRLFKWASELTAPPKAEDWVWNGYLPRGGIALLSALWKAGKTTLLTHLLSACGSGGTFLGRELKASKVLYVSEEGERHWVRRREVHGIADHAGFYLQPFDTKPALSRWLGFLDQLRKDREEHGFDLIVFDTLAKLWPVSEENDAGAVDAALMPLWKVIGDSASVLLIHHLRKSGGTEYTGSRGSGAISAFPDVIIELTRFDATDRKSKKRKLQATGRYEETPDELIIELREGGYFALSEDEAKAAKEEMKEEDEAPADEEARVVAVLAASPTPWLSSDAIKDGLRTSGGAGIRDADVAAHLTSLYHRKLVAQRGRGVKNSPKVFALASRVDSLPFPSAPECGAGMESGNGIGGGGEFHSQIPFPPVTQGRNGMAGNETPQFCEDTPDVPAGV